MSNPMFLLEVVMAAYNNPDYMRVALEAYLRQEDKDFSIVVADDGSGTEIEDLINESKQRGLNIRHIWHEDAGFRKSKILNKAIESSAADYLIFVDNDCIPQASFISDHRRAARKGHFIAGRRVNLGERLTKKILAAEIDIQQIEDRKWLFVNSIKKALKNAEFGFRLPWPLARIWSRKQVGLLGANMAFWKEDLYLVNGFDGDFVRCCSEESDLEWRLIASGVKPGALLGRGCVSHLYHETRNRSDNNLQYIEYKKSMGMVRAENGIL